MLQRWPQVVRYVVSCACIGGLLAAPLDAQPRDASAASPSVFTLVGARVVKADGELYDGLAVVVDNGRIQRIELASTTGLPTPVELPAGSVLCPGFIELCSNLGAKNQNFELASPIDAEASALDASDPSSAHFAKALAAGVTAALVWPAPINLVSGRAFVARTHVTRDEFDCLRVDGPLVFSLGNQVLRMDREPTSRGRALALLTESLRTGGQQSPTFRDYLAGRVPALFVAGDVVDVESALTLFGGGLSMPVLVADLDVRATTERLRLGRELAARKAVAILGPFTFATPENKVRIAGEWDRAGVRVALAGGWPAATPTSLRQSASLAVREGLSLAAARRALTVHAAVAGGVSHRIGAIGSGLDADLVVWSGDPLRLESEVLEVYSRGIRVVHRAALRTPQRAATAKKDIDEL
ncbi:MAG: amidohydrolase family protein [Planctomycetota bacterium]